MKIAIFHNLEKGGALFYIENISNVLANKHTIDIYSTNTNLKNTKVKNSYIFPIKKTQNIFEHLWFSLFELPQIHQKIANQINQKKYDLVLIYPCLITQSPYLLKYLSKKSINIYMFQEPKREFYENTSFKSIKNFLTNLILLPIKHIDTTNCKHSTHIVANSYYSQSKIKDIYNKNSSVIYLGLVHIEPKKITIQNNKKIISIGQLSKIKGHDFSINQLSDTKDSLQIIGRETDESENIYQIAKTKKVPLKVIHTENNKQKIKILKKHSIFLANQNKEPFGLTTLEASSNNLFVLGKNEGGTTEIIRFGLNGLLYPNNIRLAQKTFLSVLKKPTIKLYKTCKIDWRQTTDQLLSLYHRLRHEPAE